jgi:hypothetical protein
VGVLERRGRGVDVASPLGSSDNFQGFALDLGLICDFAFLEGCSASGKAAAASSQPMAAAATAAAMRASRSRSAPAAVRAAAS